MREPDELKERILEARGCEDDKRPESGHDQANLGIRILTEMIAAILVGALLGYWLDTLFGSKPVMFLIFTFIGIATGLINSFRASYGLAPLADPSRLQKDENKGKDKEQLKDGD